MAFGGIKKYHLIRMNFNEGIYQVYSYEKDRRFTAKQAWQHIYNQKPILVGQLKPDATIFTYDDLVKEFGYEPKYCDRYMTFKGFN